MRLGSETLQTSQRHALPHSLFGLATIPSSPSVSPPAPIFPFYPIQSHCYSTSRHSCLIQHGFPYPLSTTLTLFGFPIPVHPHFVLLLSALAAHTLAPFRCNIVSDYVHTYGLSLKLTERISRDLDMALCYARRRTLLSSSFRSSSL
jgi:hypothetical protein